MLGVYPSASTHARTHSGLACTQRQKHTLSKVQLSELQTVFFFFLIYSMPHLKCGLYSDEKENKSLRY